MIAFPLRGFKQTNFFIQRRAFVNLATRFLDNYLRLRLQIKEPKSMEILRRFKTEVLMPPNMITFSRILLTPAIAFSILNSDYKVAFGLIALTSISDFVKFVFCRLMGMWREDTE